MHSVVEIDEMTGCSSCLVNGRIDELTNGTDNVTSRWNERNGH